MVKLEIELTEEQAEKLEILKSNDVDIGQGIDLLFGLQKEALNQIKEQKNEEIVLDEISDSTFDAKIKHELLIRNYDGTKTYDRTVQDTKHKIKWSEFFKF